MGGLGSGRQSGSGRDRVEYHRSIDVNRLHQAGCLTPGQTCNWQWTQNDQEFGSITLRAEPTHLHLSYRVRIAGAEWETIEERVRIILVPCRFGGARPYFCCPGIINGIPCGRRVIKLYGSARYFLCRHCYRLCYASQCEDQLDRTMRWVNKIKERLGGEPGLYSPFPPKPKGMWWRNYERLRDKCIDAQMRVDDVLANHEQRLEELLKNLQLNRN